MSIKKILVANRGEIAVRVMRTAREMGIATVAVYSEVDRDAMHARYADEAYALEGTVPAQTYLNVEKILAIAQRADADAVHPGYGFLAENAGFAQATIDRGLVWIGPNPGAIEQMGDKLRARAVMREAGIPVVPGGGEPLLDVEEAREAAARFGFPLALKASAGGGGKGLKVARTLDDIPSAFATAQREAEAYFKDATIYAERFLDDPKHIELQILADKHGNVVHVGERDCSLQRRHQKLWEEAPAVIPENVRGAIREAGIRAAQAIGYDSAGTIETLVAGDEFFFLEMNTRIQVEHTVSEMLSGLDLVAEQIRIAAGEPLGYAQDAIALRGHAIEVRINAEDPARDFQPAPGTITRYEEAGGLGVRVDSAAFEGFTISPDYDSLIAKLVVWAPSRPSAIARLRRALDEFAIGGVATTIPLLRALCDESVVINNEYGTATLEPLAAEWAKRASQVSRLPLASRLRGPSGPGVYPERSNAGALRSRGARSDKQREDAIHVEVNGRLFTVRMLDQPAARDQGAARPARRKPPLVGSAPASSVPNDAVVSPMHGIVVQIAVKAGDSVEEGALLLVLEAMKMMNEIRATRAGSIASVRVQSGQTVEAGTELITYA